MTLFAHGGISKKLCGVYVYDKWNFKPKISSTFHFEHVNEVYISGVFDVKYLNSQQGRARKTSILVLAFWNFQLKVLIYIPQKL